MTAIAGVDDTSAVPDRRLGSQLSLTVRNRPGDRGSWLIRRSLGGHPRE